MFIAMVTPVIMIYIIKVYTGNSCLFHCQQLTIINNSVGIAVFPNFHLVPSSIILVKNIIVIAVQFF